MCRQFGQRIFEFFASVAAGGLIFAPMTGAGYEG
jgi:hypothetical protein